MYLLFLFMLILLNLGNSLPIPKNPVIYKDIALPNNITLDVGFSGNESSNNVFLLLHGFPENSYSWNGVVDPLVNKGYRLIIPDQRGYNKSSKPEGMEQYDISLLMEDMIELLKIVVSPGQKVTVVGHDWGGPVAWSLAGTYESYFSNCIILNGPHPSMFYELLLNNSEQQSKSSYMFFFDSSMSPYTLTSLTMPLMFYGESWFDSVTEKAYKECWGIENEINSGLHWYRQNIFGNWDNWHFTEESLAKCTMNKNLIINIPTLVLWGMKDDAFNNEENLKLDKYVKDLKIVEFLENDHWLAQQNYTEVCKQIINFMEDQEIIIN